MEIGNLGEEIQNILLQADASQEDVKKPDAACRAKVTMVVTRVLEKVISNVVPRDERERLTSSPIPFEKQQEIFNKCLAIKSGESSKSTLQEIVNLVMQQGESSAVKSSNQPLQPIPVSQTPAENTLEQKPSFREIEDQTDVHKWKPAYWFNNDVSSFIKNNLENPAIAAIDRFHYGNYHQEHTRILDIPPIQSPSQAALIKIAERYKEKYKIDIFVLKIEELKNQIEKIQSTIKEPRCIGFITAQTLTIDQGHVAPMLVFFKPGESPQFLLMDVLGLTKGTLYTDIIKNFPEDWVGEQSFASSTGIRQADDYSCRIGSITLLRNALLSFKETKDPTSYWHEVFRNASKILPPQWTYIEQMQHGPEEGQMKATAIRDKFSKKEAKRNNPRSAYQRRLDKSETVTVEHAIFFRFDDNFKKDLFTNITAPPGSTIEIRDYGVILRIVVEKNLNTYLQRKGAREKNRLL